MACRPCYRRGSGMALGPLTGGLHAESDEEKAS
jgi:hypothetical protein